MGSPQGIRRRELLAGTALFFMSASTARATVLDGQLPWGPNAGNPPSPAGFGPWVFFTADEGRTVEALADCIIPSDTETPGGKDAGCAVFIDRQLAGPYGRQEGLYLRPPFQTGAKNQGPQSATGPAQQYRAGLAALNRATQNQHAGKIFPDLSDADKVAMLHEIESGQTKLDGADGQAFFGTVIKDVQMGFFADPIYGGNRDMVAWKMIGYPGARYNYLDWVPRHNERFPLPPVGLTGRAEWTPK
jgi:gluconate 2-dehydrogenase gamma chain